MDAPSACSAVAARLCREFPLLVPETRDLTSYVGLVALTSAHHPFHIRIRCPRGPALLGPGTSCAVDDRLRNLVGGDLAAFQSMLDKAADLCSFLYDLRDAIDRLARAATIPTGAAPAHTLPPPEFYRRLLPQMRQLGWALVADVDCSLTRIGMRVVDTHGRAHTARLALPPDYPFRGPSCEMSLPGPPFQVRWGPGLDLKNVYDQCRSALNSYQDFFDEVEDLDSSVWVLEPENASLADTFRRIYLSQQASLLVRLDPRAPRSIPECHFLGSESAVGPLRTTLNAYLKQWRDDRSLRWNLLRALSMDAFPQRPNTEAGRAQSLLECGICYSYRVDGGGIPDTSCDFNRCARSFHSKCLSEWLLALPNSKQSFNTIFGQCPYCFNTISARLRPP